MRHYECVQAIIKDDDGKVVMEYHIKNHGYTIPGGKVEPGEDLDSAIIRELKEELGIDVDKSSLKLLFSHQFYGIYSDEDTEMCDFNCNIFAVSDYKGKIKNMEPDKHYTVGYMDLNYIKNPDIPKSILMTDIMDRI